MTPPLARPGGTDLTVEGRIMGTVPYMSPEQLQGKPADARTDIFAFGALAYEMISGKAPFTADSQADLIGAILKDDPQPIGRPSLTFRRCWRARLRGAWQRIPRRGGRRLPICCSSCARSPTRTWRQCRPRGPLPAHVE